MKSKHIVDIAEDASGSVKRVAKKAKKKAKKALKGFPYNLAVIRGLNFDLKDFGSAGKTAHRFIRKHPAQSVLVGMGFGIFLGTVFRDLWDSTPARTRDVNEEPVFDETEYRDREAG